jgi:hypothetical protein
VCGVGNTVSAILGSAGSKSLPSMNGTAGLTLGKPQEFTQPWESGAMMVMHTDGVTSRWRLDAYPGILRHDPAIVAAVIKRDHTRPRDDSTVLTFTVRPSEGSAS